MEDNYASHIKTGIMSDIWVNYDTVWQPYDEKINEW